MPIPFIAAAGAKLLPVKAFLARIPRGVWIALAVIAILGLGTCAHKRAVTKFGNERYAAGKADEAARIEAKAKKLAADAEKLSLKLKEKNNAENRRIAGVADTLRVSGPRKATCTQPATIGAGRRLPPIGKPDVAGPDLPSGNGEPLQELAAVPWPWLVDRAETCDMNRAEAETWRAWHKQLTEQWEKAR